MILYIEKNFQCFTYHIIWDVYKWLLISFNSELEKFNPIGLEKLHIGFRIRLRTQIYDRTKAQGLKEGEVSDVGESRTKDTIIDHGEVEWRNKEVFTIAISVDLSLLMFSGLKERRQPVDVVVVVGVDAMVVAVMAAMAVLDDGDLDSPPIVTVGDCGSGELHRRRRVERKGGGSDSEEDTLCSALIV